MLIHSLIAVRWDEQEGLFYPVGSEHGIRPFTANGILSFERRFFSSKTIGVRIITVVTIFENDLPIGSKMYGDRKVITLTHDLVEYLVAQMCRYWEQDLPFDRQKESL